MKNKKRLAIALIVLALILGTTVLLCWLAVSLGYWWVAIVIGLLFLWNGIFGYRRAAKEAKQKNEGGG